MNVDPIVEGGHCPEAPCLECVDWKGSTGPLDILRSDVAVSRNIFISSKHIHHEVQRAYGFVLSTNPAHRFLRQIAESLSEAADAPLRLTPYLIERGESANAFALPNGNVYVWPRLLQLIQSSADQVAAMLSHEYVHSLRGHAAKGIEHYDSNRIGIRTLVRAIGLGAIAEAEADVLATVALMSKAGFNPLGMVDLFKSLENFERSMKRTGRGDLQHFSSLDRRLIIESLIPVVHLQNSHLPFQEVPVEVRRDVDSLVERLTEDCDEAAGGRYEKQRPTQKRSSRSNRPPLSSLANSLARSDGQRLVERGTVIMRSLAQRVADRIEALYEKAHGGSKKPVTVGLLSKLIEEDRELARVTPAFSALLWGFDELFKRKGVSANARCWLLPLWVEMESGVDLFAPIRSTDRSLLDVLPISRNGHSTLKEELLDSIEEFETDNNGSLSGLTAAFSAEVIATLPLVFSQTTLPNPIPSILWAHRQTSLFLDPDEQTVSPEAVFRELGAFIRMHSTAAHSQELREGKADAITARKVSRLIAEVYRYEEEDLAAAIAAIPDTDPLSRQVKLLVQLDAVDGQWLPERTELRDLRRQLSELPPAERVEILVQLAPATLSLQEGQYEYWVMPVLLECLNERGMQCIEDLEKSLLPLSPQEIQGVFFDLSRIFHAMEPEDHPRIHDIAQAFLVLAAKLFPADDLLPEDTDLTFDSLFKGDSALSPEEMGEQFFVPGRSLLEAGRILGTICQIRFNGSFHKMCGYDKESHFRSTAERYLSSVLDQTSQFAAPEALAFLNEHFSAFPIDLLELRYLDSETTDIMALLEDANDLIVRLSPEAKTASDFLALTPLIVDLDVRLRVQQYAAELAGREAGYDELKALILDDPHQRVPIASAATERLMEDEANSGSELEEVSSGLIRRALDHSSEQWGQVTLIDAALESEEMNKKDFLLAALESGYDEGPLAAYFTWEWWEKVKGPVGMSIGSVSYFETEQAFESWTHDSGLDILLGQNDYNDPTSDYTIREILDKLYTATPVARSLIVQKLLTGPGGILHSKTETLAVLKAFLDRYVDFPESYGETTLKVCKAFVETATIDDLYFRIAPFLSRAIFQPPQSRVKPERVLKDSGVFNEALDYLPESLMYDQKVQRYVMRKLTNLTFREVSENSRIMGAGEKAIMERLPEQYQSPAKFVRLDTVSAIRQALTMEGQIGARLAQCIPQYWNLPPEIAPAFEGVYDQQRGQMKPEAYRTINALAPTLIRPADKLLPRIGGGSMATAYPLDRVAEPRRVLKALNPNAEVRTKQTLDVWGRVLDYLQAGGPDDQAFRFLKEQLLGDIASWILHDIRDNRFLKLDKAFHHRWHGSRIANTRIIVPVSEAVEDVVGAGNVTDPVEANIRIKLDEAVEGRNLTELSVAADTDIENRCISQRDYAAVMRAIVTNYAEQILNGVVHSNPHPGNFRVLFERSKENELQVAILDRNFYLEFPEEDMGLIKRLLIHAGNPKGMASKLISGVLNTKENKHLSAETRRNILASFEQVQISEVHQITDLARHLKLSGAHVPLRYTILLIGVNALNRMCKDAGMSGIADAIDTGRLLKAFARNLFMAEN